MKSTYSATVRVAAEHVALMSAVPAEDKEGAHDAPAGRRVFKFNQVPAAPQICLPWPCLRPPSSRRTFAYLCSRCQPTACPCVLT